MITTKADILALTSFFGDGAQDVIDPAEVDRIFDEILVTLGQDPRAWITQVAATATGTELDTMDKLNYELRENIGLVRLLALFFDDRQLVSEREENLPTFWREEIGSPLAYITEAKSDRFVQLYPRPDRVAVAQTFEGLKNGLVVVFTEKRLINIPAQLALPIALLCLAREFDRESNHRDNDFALICKGMAQGFLNHLA